MPRYANGIQPERPGTLRVINYVTIFKYKVLVIYTPKTKIEIFCRNLMYGKRFNSI
jgi:hypothetical protein